MYRQQETNVFKSALVDLLHKNCFEEIPRYSHLTDIANLMVGDDLTKVINF